MTCQPPCPTPHSPPRRVWCGMGHWGADQVMESQIGEEEEEEETVSGSDKRQFSPVSLIKLVDIWREKEAELERGRKR